jgi:hypothetical protein
MTKELEDSQVLFGPPSQALTPYSQIFFGVDESAMMPTDHLFPKGAATLPRQPTNDREQS